MYSKKTLDEFKNPCNMGEIKEADGVGNVGNPVCGDMMKVFIKMGKKNGKDVIKDIKVQTFGCVAAIATSSVMTRLAKDKTLEEALKITKDDIAKELGGLPPVKMHCSVLSLDALKKAIKEFKEKKK